MYNPFRADLMSTAGLLLDGRLPTGFLAAEPLRRDLEVREGAIARFRRWTLQVGRIRFEMHLAGSR
jgi:hypothetical protein